MSDSNTANSSSDDDTGHVIALAVGLGVSIPVAAVILILFWLCIRHRRVAREEDERHKDIDLEADISMMPPNQQHARNYSVADTDTEKDSFALPPRTAYSQGMETDDSSTYMYTPYMNEEAQRSIDGFSKSLHSLLGPSPMYPSMDRLGNERVGTSGSSLSSMPFGEPNSPRRLSAHAMERRANFSLDSGRPLPRAPEDDMLDDEDSVLTESEMGSPVRRTDPRAFQRRSIPDSLSAASSQLPIASEPEPELPPVPAPTAPGSAASGSAPPVPAPRMASPAPPAMHAAPAVVGSQTGSRAGSPTASAAASGNATATAVPAPPALALNRGSMQSSTSLHTAASHMRSKQSLLPEDQSRDHSRDQSQDEPVQLMHQPSVATVRPGETDIERQKSMGQQAVQEIYGKYGDTSYETDHDGFNDTPADRSTASAPYETENADENATDKAKAEPYNDSANLSANSATHMLNGLQDTSYGSAASERAHAPTQAPAPSLVRAHVLPPIQTAQHGPGPNGQIPNAHIPNAHMPNGQISNAHMPNVHMPNGHTPNGPGPNGHLQADTSYFPPDVSYAPSIAASSQYSGYTGNVTSPVAPQSPFADMELPNVPSVKGLPRAPSLPDIKGAQRAPTAAWGRPAVSPDFQTFGVPAPPPTRSGQPRLQISQDGQSYSQPQSPMLESPASPAPSSSISQRAPVGGIAAPQRSQVTMDQSVFFEAPRKFGNKGRGIPAASKLG